MLDGVKRWLGALGGGAVLAASTSSAHTDYQTVLNHFANQGQISLGQLASAAYGDKAPDVIQSANAYNQLEGHMPALQVPLTPDNLSKTYNIAEPNNNASGFNAGYVNPNDNSTIFVSSHLGKDRGTTTAHELGHQFQDPSKDLSSLFHAQSLVSQHLGTNNVPVNVYSVSQHDANPAELQARLHVLKETVAHDTGIVIDSKEKMFQVLTAMDFKFPDNLVKKMKLGPMEPLPVDKIKILAGLPAKNQEIRYLKELNNGGPHVMGPIDQTQNGRPYTLQPASKDPAFQWYLMREMMETTPGLVQNTPGDTDMGIV